MIVLAANKDFDLASMDIRETFLQQNTLDRDIFVEPPEDQRMEGWLWKLKKPLFGLDDAIRNFWLKLITHS